VIPQGGKKYFKGGVTPATTFWTLIYNFKVIYFRNSWATKQIQINGLALFAASATVGRPALTLDF
jgi:hypothetical protein